MSTRQMETSETVTNQKAVISFQNKIIALFFAPFAGAVFAIPTALVLVQLWAWFMVPTFGVQPLTLGSAIGLGLIMSLLTKQTMPKTGESDIDLLKRQFVGAVVSPLIALIIGFLVKGWL